MDDVKQMLRKVINGQSVMKSQLLVEINKLRTDTNKGFDTVDKKIEGVEKRLTVRIDKIGLSEAQLEDDAPTIEEFDKLEKRVTKVEQKVAAI